MPSFYPPPALSSISIAAQQSLTYKPILLCDIAFVDGITFLHFATDSITYNSITYLPVLLSNSLDRLQQLTATGIDNYPSAKISIADPAAEIFGAYELNGPGFKGAIVTLTFILVDKITGAVSTDSSVKFIGRADAPSIDDKQITFAVRSKIEVTRVTLPNVPISKLCPYPFPGTAAQQLSAKDPTSQFYPCGYLDGGGNNDPSTGAPFTSCNYDVVSCQQRGMFSIGRFGAVQYEPPAAWSNVHVYTTGTKASGWNTDNQAKYQNYVPLVYGSALVKGIVANVIGDGNYVRFEVIVAWGNCYNSWDGGIVEVIVNNVVIPHNSQDALFPGSGQNPQTTGMLAWWQFVNTGARNGTPNQDVPYNGTGDPYGSMVVIECVVPTTIQSSSNSVPDVLVFVDNGKLVRSYQGVPDSMNPMGIFTDGDYTGSNPIATITDMLVTAGAFNYSDFDIQTILDAQSTCEVAVPYSGVAGNYTVVDVESDGITVLNDNVGGGGAFATVVYANNVIYPVQVFNGQVVNIIDPTTNIGTLCIIDTIDSATQLTLVAPGYGGPLSSGQFQISHQRYRLNLVMQNRQSMAPLLNSIKLGCNLNIVTNNVTNLLQFFIDQGLGDQQPSPITGSNDNQPYPSYLATAYKTGYNSTGHGGADIADGRIGVGYVAYHFYEGNIVLNGNADNYTSSLTIIQSPPQDTPNRIITPFQNEDIMCESDTSTRVDTDDYTRMQQTYEATVQMEGVPNYDQLFRRANNYMARTFRGNPRSPSTYGDTGGTIIVQLTAVGAQTGHLRVGHIVALSSVRFGFGGSPPFGPSGSPQFFRIQALQASDDFATQTITMAWHDDRWFLDGYGNGPDPRFSISTSSATIRPPFAWQAYHGTQPVLGVNTETTTSIDPVYPDLQTWLPSVTPLYEVLADGSIDASIYTQGIFPANIPSSLTSTPYIALQGAVDVSTGTIPPGLYYIAVVAIDSNGGVSFPQSTQNMCQVSLSATGSIILPIIVWKPGSVQGAYYVGTDPNFMSFQGYINPVSLSLPTNITIGTLQGAISPSTAAFPIPDQIFDHINILAKVVRHAGPVGALGTITYQIISGVGTFPHITTPGADWGSGQWAGYNLAIIGINNNISQPIPVFNVGIQSSGVTLIGLNPAAATAMQAAFPSGTSVVYIIYSNPAVSTDSNGNTVLTDGNWENSLGPPGVQVTISNITPGLNTLFTTLNPHGLISSSTITIYGVTGTIGSVVNTTFAGGLTIFDAYNFSIAFNTSTYNYVSGGTFYVNGGLAVNAESGKIARFLNSNGTSWTMNILSNTGTAVTLSGASPVTLIPGEFTYIIEENNWNTLVTTTSIQQSTTSGTSYVFADIKNYIDTTILVRVDMCDQDGNTNAINQSPVRMMWVFGKEGQVTGTTFNPGYSIVTPTGGIVTVDLAEGLNFGLFLTSGTPPQFNPPVFTGGSIKNGTSISIYLFQPPGRYVRTTNVLQRPRRICIQHWH